MATKELKTVAQVIAFHGTTVAVKNGNNEILPVTFIGEEGKTTISGPDQITHLIKSGVDDRKVSLPLDKLKVHCRVCRKAEMTGVISVSEAFVVKGEGDIYHRKCAAAVLAARDKEEARRLGISRQAKIDQRQIVPLINPLAWAARQEQVKAAISGEGKFLSAEAMTEALGDDIVGKGKLNPERLAERAKALALDKSERDFALVSRATGRPGFAILGRLNAVAICQVRKDLVFDRLEDGAADLFRLAKHMAGRDKKRQEKTAKVVARLESSDPLNFEPFELMRRLKEVFENSETERFAHPSDRVEWPVFDWKEIVAFCVESGLFPTGFGPHPDAIAGMDVCPILVMTFKVKDKDRVVLLHSSEASMAVALARKSGLKDSRFRDGSRIEVEAEAQPLSTTLSWLWNRFQRANERKLQRAASEVASGSVRVRLKLVNGGK